MSRTAFDRLVIEKSLAIVNRSDQANLKEWAIEKGGDGLTKNVCAKVAPELSDRIDNIIGLLGVSKRQFLEALFLTGCDQAEQAMREEGVYQSLKEDAKEVSL
jgi:hypothetical protein